MQVFSEILYFWFIAFHYFITGLFFFAFARVVIARHAPFAGFYVASIFFVQAVYNGCPFVDVQNWLALRAGYAADSNQFLFGAFGDYTLAARVVFFALSLVVLQYSYQAWNRPQVQVNFGRCFRRFGWLEV